jgi:cell wall-associated NlpC family hydrolase
MPSVRRATCVTLVTLLAAAGPQLGNRAEAASPAVTSVHPTLAQQVETRRHRPKKLTRRQRYFASHPRLVRAGRIALAQRGDRYRFGAEGPHRFDCSGLVYYAYGKAGFRDLPRTSQEQYRHVRHIRKRQLRHGDLIFFRSHHRVYHVAIFLYWRDGRRVFVHAPSPGGRVRKGVPWTDHWRAGTLRPAPRKHHKSHQKH